MLSFLRREKRNQLNRLKKDKKLSEIILVNIDLCFKIKVLMNTKLENKNMTLLGNFKVESKIQDKKELNHQMKSNQTSNML